MSLKIAIKKKAHQTFLSLNGCDLEEIKFFAKSIVEIAESNTIINFEKIETPKGFYNDWDEATSWNHDEESKRERSKENGLNGLIFSDTVQLESDPNSRLMIVGNQGPLSDDRKLTFECELIDEDGNKTTQIHKAIDLRFVKSNWEELLEKTREEIRLLRESQNATNENPSAPLSDENVSDLTKSLE